MREETVDRIISHISEKEKRIHEYYLSSSYEKCVTPREMYAYIEAELRQVRHMIEELRE